MTKIRRIAVSQVEGGDANNTDTNEIRPFGETAFYLDTDGDTNKLVLMMFDGVRTHQKSKVLSPGVLYGSNADSGDGAGLDTIKLIPDATLHDNGSNQYLIIDPTGPDHIHLRAGGTIDNSSAELFLGGEKNHVRISDGNDTVIITTTQASEGDITRNWTFDNTGVLTLPSGGDILDNSGNSVLDADSELVGTGAAQIGFKLDIATNQGGGLVGWGDQSIAVAYNADIISTYTAGSTITFQDGSTATITQVDNYGPTYIDIFWDTPKTGDLFPITLTTSNYAAAVPFIARINVTDKQWSFNENGWLTIPNNGVIQSNNLIALSSFNNDNATARVMCQSIANSARINLRTTLSTGAQKDWLFESTGNMTFPDLTVQTTAWAGGRVVSAPASSIGAAGDKQGDLAFDGSYMYYCTQDFASETYSTTIVLTYTGLYPDIVKGSIPQPQAGWAFVHNGTTYTLASNAVENNPGEWNCELTTNISVTAGDTVTVGPVFASNIWKRVAWSVDTW